jgi:magnesium transporter
MQNSPNVNSGQVQIIGPNGEVWDEDKDLQEVEDLFETYFTHIDSTFRNLEQLNEYIDDMEDLIEIELDSKRNQLIKLELLLTTGTLCLSGFGVVVGVFGMNIRNGLEGSQSSFELVIVFSVIGSVLTFAAIVQACRYFRLF